MLTIPECAFLALCRLASPLASPGPRCSRVEAGVPFMRKYPSAAPVTTPSNRPSTQRMPSTRSSAATKCISEVPGLEKQTSTPPATNVRTRLSAPFIVCSPASELFLEVPDQPLFTRFVKGLADKSGIAGRMCHFLTGKAENDRGHRLVACESCLAMACLAATLISRGRIMTRVFAWLCAVMTVLAAGHAQAQGFDMRDIMG